MVQSGSVEQFRRTIRTFLRENLPADMARRNIGANYSSREDTLQWTAILSRQGWSVPHWPKQYGGTGWTPVERHLFDEECFLAGAPRPNSQGVSLVGPVIYTFGTEAQKECYLPDIIAGRVIWAQGFSEPEAGSDLASLRTRAVRDADHYVINGQKIWTTQAYMSDMIFCLVRTDPTVKPQSGISFLLIPSDASGVTIRRIPSIDGYAHLCETFFQDVRVPIDNLIGEEGAGWTYAKFLLGNERTSVAELPRNKRNLRQLKYFARSTPIRDRWLMDDPDFASRLARREMDLHALESSVLEWLGGANNDELSASAIKIRGTELLQAVAQLQAETLGSAAAIELPDVLNLSAAERDGLPGPRWAAGVMSDLLYFRATTIYGGTTEIQKNILGKGILSRQSDGADPLLNEEQRLLRDSARRVATTEAGRARLASDETTAREELRARFADMGWLGLSVPESEGGVGMSPADAHVLLEELGSHLILEPSMVAHTLAVELLKFANGSRVARECLSKLIAGGAWVAVAYDEVEARGAPDWLSTTAKPAGDGWTLDGHKILVLGAEVATHLIIWARTRGASGAVSAADGTLFLVESSRPGIDYQHYRLIDGRHASNIALSGVKVGRADVLGEEDGGLPLFKRAIEHATIGACAEALGLLNTAFWITRDYLLARRQFGQRLADFQALRHRLAEMFVQIDQARAILRAGAEALTGDDAARRCHLASAAKATFGRVAKFVGAQVIQLHGGMGMASECRIGRYYKALLTFETLYGNEAEHTRRFREHADLTEM